MLSLVVICAPAGSLPCCSQTRVSEDVHIIDVLEKGPLASLLKRVFSKVPRWSGPSGPKSMRSSGLPRATAIKDAAGGTVVPEDDVRVGFCSVTITGTS